MAIGDEKTRPQYVRRRKIRAAGVFSGKIGSAGCTRDFSRRL